MIIQCGGQQCCVLCHKLFNLYSKMVHKAALSEREQGVLVNGEKLNNYVLDTVIFADIVEGLKQLIDRTFKVDLTYDLKLNIKKTKLKIMTRNNYITGRLTIYNGKIENLDEITYL